MNYTNLEIVSDRIILKLISMQHVEEMFLAFDLEVTKYMLPTQAKHIDITKSYIITSQLNALEGKSFAYMILKKDTCEFLGCGSVDHLDRKYPELGIWLKKETHGNHYGFEAVKASFDYFKNQYEGFIYPVDRRNIASKKIALKLGGDIRKTYSQKNASGRLLYLEEYLIKAN